jgi:hypothetical protein
MAERYLTSAGHAVAERRRWQNRIEEEMAFIVMRDEGARWTTLVNRFSREISLFPEWGRNYLLSARPDDPETAIEGYARTLGTAAYNHHVLFALADEGIPFKMWLTRRDNRVRQSHKDADGQKVPLSSPFRVDGFPMQFPADARTAPMDVWIGCRCMVLGRTR